MTPETYMHRYHASCGCEEESAVTAEELFSACPLAAAETGREGCGCGQTEPTPAPLPTCCCKASMVEALRLLCNTELAEVVDFDAFFFLTDFLAVGGNLSVPATGPDNIAGLAASFQRFSPCNCDLLDVNGTAYFAVPGTTSVAMEAVDQLTLCSLKAVAFQILEADCPRDCGDSNYDRAVRAIRRAIRAEGGSTGACGTCGAHCNCDDCCCAAGIVRELSTRNLSRMATLTAGPLVLQNVTVLGSLGSALVLADEALSRFYLVCANAVEAIG